MSELNNAANRQIQDRFDTRRLADHLEQRIVHVPEWKLKDSVRDALPGTPKGIEPA